jgi:hypothetical protein
MAQSLTQALLDVQKAAPKLQLDKINPHFGSRYLSLGALMGEVLPVLNEHGLIWLTLPGRDESGHPALAYRLVHAATGHQLEGAIPLMLQKGTPQEQGSAITYARRYALMAVLGLVADEDDDGQQATKAASEPRVPAQSAPTDDGFGPGARSDAAEEQVALKQAVAELTAELKKTPAEWAKVEAWAKERSLSLTDPPANKLRAVERALRGKVERLQAEAKS